MEDQNFHASDIRDIVKDCNNSCKLAVDILTDILAYDKLEAGDMKLHCAPIPVRLLLHSAQKLFLTQVLALLFPYCMV